MSLSQLKKILQDLNSTNEKLKILALMHTPRLSARNEYPVEDIQKLHHIIEKHLEYPNPDIAFLSRKAFNFLKENLPVTTITPTEKKEELFIGKEEAKSIFTPSSINDFSTEPFEICNQLDLIPDSFRETKIITHFLDHANPRVQAAAIEAVSRICPIKEQKKLLTSFLNSENNRIRANAIMALGTEDFSSVSESLDEMLNTTRISMRESAVFAIGKLPPNLQLQNLLLRVLHDPYRDIRLRAIEILQNYPSSEVALQMRRLSNDMDIEICEKSAKTLSSIENKLHGQKPDRNPEESENAQTDTNENTEEEESDIWNLNQETKDYSKQDKESDYDEFVGDDEEFLEVNPLQDSFEIESNFIDVPKKKLEQDPSELIIDKTPQDKSTEDILFDLFATETEEQTTIEDGITDLFEIDETAEKTEEKDDFFRLDNKNKENDLPELSTVDQQTPAKNNNDSATENNEIEDLFVTEKEFEPAVTEQEEDDFFNIEKIGPTETNSFDINIATQEEEQEEEKKEFDFTLGFENDEEPVDDEITAEKTIPQTEKNNGIEELIRLYEQKQQREKLINDWNAEIFFSPPAIKISAQNIFGLFTPGPMDNFARSWLGASVVMTEPQTKEKSIQQQINELLKEVGTEVFHLLSENKTDNKTINAVLKNLSERQKQLRNFYQSKPPQSQQNALRLRSLQKAVQDSFSALGRSCLQEVRQQRFNLPRAVSYQKRLQALVSQLNSSKDKGK
jgi:hypothetical protein